METSKSTGFGLGQFQIQIQLRRSSCATLSKFPSLGLSLLIWEMWTIPNQWGRCVDSRRERV